MFRYFGDLGFNLFDGVLMVKIVDIKLRIWFLFLFCLEIELFIFFDVGLFNIVSMCLRILRVIMIFVFVILRILFGIMIMFFLFCSKDFFLCFFWMCCISFCVFWLKYLVRVCSRLGWLIKRGIVISIKLI